MNDTLMMILFVIMVLCAAGIAPCILSSQISREEENEDDNAGQE